MTLFYRSITTLTFASALLIPTIGIVPGAKADEWNKETVMTISEPLQVPNKLLEPGTYVLKLMDDQANRHVVQIFNKDKTRLITTILAIPNRRLQPTGKTAFAYWETPAGQPPALRAWFYPGDNFGQEFAYPKQVASQISAYNKMEVPTSPEADNMTKANANQNEQQTPAPTKTASAAPAEPAPTQQTASDAGRSADRAAEAQAPDQPQTYATQTTPAPSPLPAPAPSETPSELPQTGSFYPLIGFAGILSVFGYLALTVFERLRA